MEKFKLEKRGCDFFRNSNINSDIGNYRIGIYNYSITGENGIDYLVEFCRWDAWRRRKTNKITGKPLKKPVREIVLKDALLINTQYCDDENGCFRDAKLENKINTAYLPYTIEGIEKALQIITGKKYKFDGFIN